MLNDITVIPNGLVLYHGPSMFTQRPIVAIATGLKHKSHNPKTGQAIQTYILADEWVSPLNAAYTGQDESICGNCIHRPQQGMTLGSCYVDLTKGPGAVYDGFLRGIYPVADKRHDHLFVGRYLRLGAYGDPAAVPVHIWRRYTKLVRHWTGYTHAWRTASPEYARYCMASCETVADRELAVSMGWRTFRTRLENEPLAEGEFVCPASEEAGKRLTCAACKACGGKTDSPKAASPAIFLHGLKWKVNRYKEAIKGRIALDLV